VPASGAAVLAALGEEVSFIPLVRRRPAVATVTSGEADPLSRAPFGGDAPRLCDGGSPPNDRRQPPQGAGATQPEEHRPIFPPALPGRRSCASLEHIFLSQATAVSTIE